MLVPRGTYLNHPTADTRQGTESRWGRGEYQDPVQPPSRVALLFVISASQSFLLQNRGIIPASQERG